MFGESKRMKGLKMKSMEEDVMKYKCLLENINAGNQSILLLDEELSQTKLHNKLKLDQTYEKLKSEALDNCSAFLTKATKLKKLALPYEMKKKHEKAISNWLQLKECANDTLKLHNKKKLLEKAIHDLEMKVEILEELKLDLMIVEENLSEDILELLENKEKQKIPAKEQSPELSLSNMASVGNSTSEKQHEAGDHNKKPSTLISNPQEIILSSCANDLQNMYHIGCIGLIDTSIRKGHTKLKVNKKWDKPQASSTPEQELYSVIDDVTLKLLSDLGLTKQLQKYITQQKRCRRHKKLERL